MTSRGQEYFRGAELTGVWAIPELFGFERAESVKQFSIDNPVAGFVMSAVGSSVPYLGWYKASKYIPSFERAINAIGEGKAARAPFLWKGAQEAARFFPLEAGRVISRQAVGSSSL